MWKFKNVERVDSLKSRVEKLVAEDKEVALAEVRKNKKKVENIVKVLDSLLVSVVDVDHGLWRHVADARKYAGDLKRFLDEYEKSLISKGGKHD
ncbi:MAG: hypothetical protein J7J61_07020 [Candidatus Hydrothermae bacterium]|nr:hypothetical protein [Candidatus Hydrothermae bacterium]